VVVTWNSGGVVGGLLDSLVDHPAPEPFEVVVVDNGSTDDTVDVVRRHPVGARLVVNDQNEGLAAANNVGLAGTSAPFALIVNPDVRVGDGAIAALVALLERHPRAAFGVPRLRYPDGRPQASAGDLPTLTGALLGRQASARLGRGESGFWWDGWAHDEERRIGRGHECCYLVRREAIADIGPQDERFALDWEGIDWTARATAAGWEVWFTPDAEVVHLGGDSIRQVPLRWIAGSHRGMYRYFAKRSSPLTRPLIALLVGLRALLKVLTAAGPASYDRSHRT
jgi:GT2 family glycosyltransferase